MNELNLSKKIQDEFSEQVEMLKDQMRFDSYSETLEYIMENNLYENIPMTFSNISNFINKSLKEKLLIEFSRKGMIKKQYCRFESKVLF